MVNHVQVINAMILKLCRALVEFANAIQLHRIGT